MNRTVLISGLGIAGPTLAYWLKAGGFQPTLIERAPALRTGGYVIDFWGLGYDIAERMQLTAALDRIGYHMREMRVVDDFGGRITGFGTEVFDELTNGPYVTIRRSDLSRLLFDRLRGTTEVIFESGIVALQEQDDGVEVQLENAGTRASEHDTAIYLVVRPGDYVFPGTPIALMKPAVEGADLAVRNATALGAQRVSASDLRFAVRQLVEVAVRALSPGINDPHTAISVLDRLGAALCEIQPLYFRTGVSMREERLALFVPHIQYGQLLNTMFHMIRQNAAGHATVLIRMLEVLTQVAACDRDADRLAHLERHADLVRGDAERTLTTPADFGDLRRRHSIFKATLNERPLGQFQMHDRS